MPVYEFVTVDDELVERHYPMAEAPRIGEIVQIDGKKAVRVIRPDRMHVGGRSFQEFESYQVNPHHPAIQKRGRHGRAAFGSKREIERFTERCKKLAETHNPAIPVYEFDQASDMERCDIDTENANLMKKTSQRRRVGEALRGMGAIDASAMLEGE
jgi:hypothetical protein